MRNVINGLYLIAMVISFISCSTDDNLLDENIASLYVGTWTNNYSLSKDVNSVGIERVNDNEIRMVNFFNLEKETIFSVEENNLTITSTKVGGYTVSGNGTSNYSYDEIIIYYKFDGDDHKASLIRLE